MNHPGRTRQSILELGASLLVLSLLFFYTYVFIFKVPYLGFGYSASTNVIGEIYVQQGNQPLLLAGDRIAKVDGEAWDVYSLRRSGARFSTYRPGDLVQLEIARDGKTLQVAWTMPGINPLEASRRIRTSLFLLLPYIFWLAGTIVILTVRPRDERRNLMAIFFYTSAIWIIAGTVSSWTIFLASEIFHLAAWLILPIAWHLNWAFPQPIRRLPGWYWPVFYSLALVCALVDLTRVLPFNPFPIPLAFAAIGSMVILLMHLYYQPEFRRQVAIILTGIVGGALPGLALFATPTQNPNIDWLTPVAMLALSLMPAAYLYAIYYHRVGELELRANSVLSLLYYGVLIFLINYFSIYFLTVQGQIFTTPLATIIPIAIINCLATALFYPRFKMWVENRMLGMPSPPVSILAGFVDQIISTPDQDSLVRLLRDRVFPSLLVRQVCLLQIETTRSSAEADFQLIFRANLGDEQLPKPAELDSLISFAGHYIPPPQYSAAPPIPLAWMRLCLIKQLTPKMLILCLFGRRDPDDYYAPTELYALQVLVDNASLKLATFEQYRLLHTLYQEDIDREEHERTRMAYDLHDDVLGQLALLAQAVNETESNEEFFHAYHNSVERVREIIGGLRPPLLNFGLSPALNGLPDELIGQGGEKCALVVDIPNNENRYPADVEIHLYRIVQQACENALRHSQAQSITVSGRLEAGQVSLDVQDDGVGILSDEPLSLAWLVSHKHFGLAGMYERAELIKANLLIRSQPGHGTQVSIDWQAA